jgi:hypothetical protein
MLRSINDSILTTLQKCGVKLYNAFAARTLVVVVLADNCAWGRISSIQKIQQLYD